MADNQTNTLMKNCILTHNELQLNLFHAFTYGLMQANVGENLHIVFDSTEREYVWKVVHHPTKESSAVAGKPVFYHYINKGDYQMNDVRLGVTTSYLREQAEQFLSDFEKFKQGIPKGGTYPCFNFHDVVQQKEPHN